MSLDTLTSQPMPIHARRHGDVVQVRSNGREINLPVAHLGGGRLALRPASEGVPTHNETLAACEALSNHATEEVLVVLDRALWCAHEAQLLKSGCAQVLVGEEHARGADYITAWLPSLMHYMFLAEPRTQALVGEPAASHHQQIRNLTRSGFARVKDFDFAHKRATLVRLERDYFFKSRLWARPDPEDPGRPLRLSCSALLTRGNTK